MINLGFFVLCLIRMLILCIDMVTRWPSHLANLCYFAKSKKTHKTFLNIGYSGIHVSRSTTIFKNSCVTLTFVVAVSRV